MASTPPGTIIRRRGTLKYPVCPIGRRSPVTPLRYGQERCTVTLLPVSTQAYELVLAQFSRFLILLYFSLCFFIFLSFFFFELP